MEEATWQSSHWAHLNKREEDDDDIYRGETSEGKGGKKNGGMVYPEAGCYSY